MTIGFVVVKSNSKQYMNPEWVDPHDWSIDRDPLHKLCPQTEACKPCENTAKGEYLRLVNSLFDPKEFRVSKILFCRFYKFKETPKLKSIFYFQFDESTNYLYRTVHIHMTKKQVEMLQKSTDPVYIDGLISEILSQTQFGTVQLVKESVIDVASTVWNHMPSMPSMSDINFNALPRSRPILINFVIMIFTYFMCRRFRVNCLVVVFFALVYFLYEYLDNQCHRVSVLLTIYTTE